MRYFNVTDEGLHTWDWGGDPTYWLEINDRGDADRQIDVYPNGNVLSYDSTHPGDEDGALSIMVVDGDDAWWAPYAITRADFESAWAAHRPINRRR